MLNARERLSLQVHPASQLLGDPNPERARRATQAMLQMKKLDIAALEQAANG